MSSDLFLEDPDEGELIELREQLTAIWRQTVDRLTVLSIELYGRCDDPADPAVAALEADLDALRQTLHEIEETLRRLPRADYAGAKTSAVSAGTTPAYRRGSAVVLDTAIA